MRLTLMILPMLAVAACTTPDFRPDLQTSTAPQAGAQTVPQAAAVFDIPMDPGSIRCDRLSNPAALSAASEWSMGQARAGVLSGRVASLPDASTLSSNLAGYCSTNGSSDVRTAVAQLGL